MLFKTYKMNKSMSLHDWSKSRKVNSGKKKGDKSNLDALPCNEDIFGIKLFRAEANSVESKEGEETQSFNPTNLGDGSIVTIITKVSYKKKKVKGTKGINYQINRDNKKQCEVLRKFCESTGTEIHFDLDKTSSYADVTPAAATLKIKGVNQTNTFYIKGTFLIKDFEKFKNSYNKGIGMHKSYGCGLIVVL